MLPRMDDGNPPLSALHFDPSQGTVIRKPRGRGYGHWVGGMKAHFDATSGKFHLFYRHRTPLEQGRGGRCAVAESDDGIEFRDVWQASKQELCAHSIEVAAPVRMPSGEWRLYVSYEYVHGGHWRIDVIRGQDPGRFDTQGRRTVIGPKDFGLDFIKDPFVVLREGQTWLYAVGTPRRAPTTNDGIVRAATREASLLFPSDDGLYFDRARYVLEPSGEGWDGSTARLGCVFPYGGGYAAFYDGARSIYDMYEEGTGLARSSDGLRFERVSTQEPFLRSPLGNVRYAYGLRVENELYVYYEFTRADASHDMRVMRLRL